MSQLTAPTPSAAEISSTTSASALLAACPTASSEVPAVTCRELDTLISAVVDPVNPAVDYLRVRGA